jgi:hypothetical protein
LFENDVIITLGKPDYIIRQRTSYIFPYRVNDNNDVDARIGVYEIKKDDILKYDDEHDIDIAKLGNPLLFCSRRTTLNNNTDAKTYLFKWEKKEKRKGKLNETTSADPTTTAKTTCLTYDVDAGLPSTPNTILTRNPTLK